MVAFMCNRPAMHLTERGWSKDDATNCLKDPVDILNYCRKVPDSLTTCLSAVIVANVYVIGDDDDDYDYNNDGDDHYCDYCPALMVAM